MLRAKLLNRSGWKAARWSVLALILAVTSAIGNAQQATGSASQVVQKTSAPGVAISATTAISSTKTNQQPQHRVSVAPQGGELGKKTGAATWDSTGTVTIFKLELAPASTLTAPPLLVRAASGKIILECTKWDSATHTPGDCYLENGATLDDAMTAITQALYASAGR